MLLDVSSKCWNASQIDKPVFYRLKKKKKTLTGLVAGSQQVIRQDLQIPEDNIMRSII